MLEIHNIILRPLLTEKTSSMTEKFNRYSFLVERFATKNQIKVAIETFFNVKVLSINTSVTPRKNERSGRVLKKGVSQKRAYVKLKDGQKIELFKGV